MNKPRGYIIGTLTEDAEVIQSNNGKTFMAFTVESDPDNNSQYPTRTKCVVFDSAIYPDKVENAAQFYRAGAMVRVDGKVSAEAYVSKKTGKPVGVVKIFAQECSVERQGAGASQPSQAPARPSSAPAQAAPAADDSDVPF